MAKTCLLWSGGQAGNRAVTWRVGGRVPSALFTLLAPLFRIPVPSEERHTLPGDGPMGTEHSFQYAIFCTTPDGGSR